MTEEYVGTAHCYLKGFFRDSHLSPDDSKKISMWEMLRKILERFLNSQEDFTEKQQFCSLFCHWNGDTCSTSMSLFRPTCIIVLTKANAQYNYVLFVNRTLSRYLNIVIIQALFFVPIQ